MTRRRRSDEGVVLVLVALFMVAVLITVGIVLDIGQLRQDRQSNKRVADAAVAAATFDVQSGPWRAVCTAYEYVLANADGFSSFSSESWSDASATPTAVASTPGACPSTAPYGAPCVTADPSTWARFQGTARDGDISVTISSGYTLPDPAFAEDAAISGDDGEPCDQVAVIVREQRQPVFGRVAGVDRQQTTMRSVGRITPGDSQVAALVVLDRTACRAVDASTNGGKLVVHANGDTPGSISVDSDGSSCGSGGQKVVEGSPLPNSQLPNVIADSTITSPAKSGRISIFALGLNPTSAHTLACASPTTSPCSISPVPRRLPVRITRTILDERYLAAVRGVVTTADAALNVVPTGLTALTGVAGIQVTGGSNPTCRVDTDIEVPGPGVHIDCDLIVESGGRLRLTGDGATIIASGTISVAGTNGPQGAGEFIASRPSAFYVEGTTQGSALAINVGGVFRVGDGGGAVTSCPTPSPGNPTTKMVVRNGTFTVGGGSSSLRLCQTAMIMAGGWLPSGGAPPTAWPTTNGAAPYTNNFKSLITVSGQGAVEWSAPNAVPTGPATPADWGRLEDLTLWTEASTASTIGGQGGVTLAGVFALPNADAFTIGGTGTQTIGADAQFWTRRLALSGQAVLDMAPNPDDSVPTIDFTLVR